MGSLYRIYHVAMLSLPLPTTNEMVLHRTKSK